jgi:general secretion pathway protein H
MSRGRSAQRGFTLIEMVCVLAIIAILAAILLPRMPRETSRPRLEGYAVETASLLRADRNNAISNHVQVTTEVDATDRIVRSGSTRRVVRIPGDVIFDALLAQRCNDRPSFSTISFFASGMSCGGTIILSHAGNRYEIRVNWLTGGVEIVAPTAS